MNNLTRIHAAIQQAHALGAWSLAAALERILKAFVASKGVKS